MNPKLALLTLLVSTSALAEDVPQWRDLFNGTGFTGWVDVKRHEQGHLERQRRPARVQRTAHWRDAQREAV